MNRFPRRKKRPKRKIRRETLWLLAAASVLNLLFYNASVEITRRDYGPVELVHLHQASGQPALEQPAPPSGAAPPPQLSHTVTQTVTVQDGGGSPSAAPPPSGDAAARFPMDINAATQQDLMEVSGIGQVKAGRILDYLAQHRPISSMEELLEVEGIGEKTLEKLKELFYALG